MAVAYAFKSLGGRARETSTAWGLAHAADTSVRISDSSGLKVQRERTLSTMRGAGSRVRAPGAAAGSAATTLRFWRLVPLTILALAGCAGSPVTIPVGCTPAWTHVVGRADREPSVWTLGVLCERGAVPYIVPGAPL